MNITDFDVLGFYEPGFFHLKVNTDHELVDLNQLANDPETAPYFSTFFHEYIHFLQDITTSSGLVKTIHLIDVLKEYIYEVRNDGKAEFKTPLTLSNPSNMDANNQLQSIYRGDVKPVSYIKYSHYDQEIEIVADKDGQVFNVTRYRVSYHLADGRPGSFYFGSACIKEFVAHALQSKYAPSTIHADIPYNVAALIVEKEFPELADDNMMITALCDASMLALHPAQMFFELIIKMNSRQFIPKDAMEIYNFMHDNFTFDAPVGKINLDELIDFQVTMAIDQLQNVLQSEIFEPNLRWVNHLLFEAYTLRKEIPDFMTRLVECEGKLSPFFYSIFHRIGSPFFTNQQGKGGFIPPKTLDATGIQPFQLLVFREIIKVFSGQRQCKMYEFCRTHSEKDITNEKCLTSPWERGMEDELCPFGQFWKTWGLNGETPVSQL